MSGTDVAGALGVVCAVGALVVTFLGVHLDGGRK